MRFFPSRVFVSVPDVRTDVSGSANTGVIAGITAALVLLLALILVALYINYHPAAASPLYLIQVSTDHAHPQVSKTVVFNFISAEFQICNC